MAILEEWLAALLPPSGVSHFILDVLWLACVLRAVANWPFFAQITIFFCHFGHGFSGAQPGPPNWTTALLIGGTAAGTCILFSGPDQIIFILTLIRLVVYTARKPIVQYFKFQNTDEENLVQLLPGLLILASFLLPILAWKAVWLFWDYLSAICIFITVLGLNYRRPQLPEPSLPGFIAKLMKSIGGVGFILWDAAFDIPRDMNRRVEAWEAQKSAVSSAELPVFRYDIHCPLNAAKREIRILKLQRRTWQAELQCDFVCFSIDDARTLPFEAISYTWGTEKPTENIIVNGCRLAVTPTVSKHLRYRRSFFSEAYLWLDAVCIDQNNIQEKKWQILLMGEIYGRATRTLIWLAHPSEARDSSQARELLCALWDLELRFSPSKQMQQSWRLWTLQRSPYIPALSALLSRNYFHRIWVVQEVARAQKVHIMYGHVTIQWDILAQVVPSLLEPENMGHVRGQTRLGGPPSPSAFAEAHPFNNISWHLCNIASMDMIRRMYLDKEPLALYEVLTTLQLRFFLATDPRDILFGLLGLISDPEFAGQPPNYAEPVEALYTRTARYFITQTKSLSVLQYAGTGYKRTLKDLPSWVPDWSQPSMAFSLPARLVGTQDTPLYSCRSADGNFGQDQNMIDVEVQQFDQVFLAAEPILPTTTFEQPSYSAMVTGASGAQGSGFYTDILAGFATWITGAKSLAASFPPTQQRCKDIEPTLFDLLTGGVYLPSLKAAMREAKAYQTFQIMLRGFEALLIGCHQENSNPNYPAFQQAVKTAALSSGIDLEDEGAITAFTADFGRLMYAMGASGGGKKFGLLKSGGVALVPPGARAGDDICYIKGAPVAFLSRNGPKGLELVGSCHAQGDDTRENTGEWRTVYLA